MPPTAKKAVKADQNDADSESGALCSEHFPLGWDDPATSMYNNPAHKYPAVTCEHGTWQRPVDTASDADAGKWRVLDPDGNTVASGEAVQTAYESGIFTAEPEQATP